jgi:hypothetical protein
MLFALTAPLVPQKEPCHCRVCRSDLCNIVPCELQDAIEFTVQYSAEEIEQIKKGMEE